MKIIDRTPFQNAQGGMDFSGRIQGWLKYGFNWPSELQAQMAVIAQLDRILEKGFLLIRNFTLPNSDIVIPLILIGPSGVSVIKVSPARGVFEAKGDQWNTVVNNKSQPASDNLLNYVMRLARAVQVYFDRMKIELPGPVDPLLIMADPGAHIESMRPSVRVVQSDGIRQFAASLLQAKPLLRPETVYALGDRIVEGHFPETPQVQSLPSASQSSTPAVPDESASRAKAIFNAPEQPVEFDSSELGFAFDEGNVDALQPMQASRRETNPAVPLPRELSPKNRKILGLTGRQLALLVGIILVECCVLVIGVYIVYSSTLNP